MFYSVQAHTLSIVHTQSQSAQETVITHTHTHTHTLLYCWSARGVLYIPQYRCCHCQRHHPAPAEILLLHAYFGWHSRVLSYQTVHMEEGYGGTNNECDDKLWNFVCMLTLSCLSLSAPPSSSLLAVCVCPFSAAFFKGVDLVFCMGKLGVEEYVKGSSLNAHTTDY